MPSNLFVKQWFSVLLFMGVYRVWPTRSYPLPLFAFYIDLFVGESRKYFCGAPHILKNKVSPVKKEVTMIVNMTSLGLLEPTTRTQVVPRGTPATPPYPLIDLFIECASPPFLKIYVRHWAWGYWLSIFMEHSEQYWHLWYILMYLIVT